MDDFRTLINEAKQSHNYTVIQQTEAASMEVSAYVEQLATAIKDRLLTVARDYLGEVHNNYTGFLLWDSAPERLFERHDHKIGRWFHSINATDIMFSPEGQTIFRCLKDILSDDGIDLCGSGFSRFPSLRSGDDFKVEPFVTPSTAPIPQGFLFIIDDFTAITPKDLPDRFQLPLTYRFVHNFSNINGIGYSSNYFEVYEGGKRVFSDTSLSGASVFWKFSYNL